MECQKGFLWVRISFGILMALGKSNSGSDRGRGEQMKSIVRVDDLRYTNAQTQLTENILNKETSRVRS